MSSQMFPVPVQLKIIELHIAFLAGLHVNTKRDNLKAELQSLQKQIDDFKISSSVELEGQRVEFLNELSEKLKKSFDIDNAEPIAIANTLHADLDWSYGASDYAKRYENHIHMANLEGAEIYDSCLKYIEVVDVERLSYLMINSLMLADEHNFKVKFGADAETGFRCAGTLRIYTTSLGMFHISEFIRKDATLSFDTARHMFYAMPLECGSFEVLKAMDLKVRRDNLLDNRALLKTSSWLFNDESRYEDMGRMFAASTGANTYFQDVVHYVHTRNNEPKIPYYPTFDAENVGKRHGFDKAFELLLSK